MPTQDRPPGRLQVPVRIQARMRAPERLQVPVPIQARLQAPERLQVPVRIRVTWPPKLAKRDRAELIPELQDQDKAA